VLLAGGASSRMGRDKASFAVGGETLAARAARRLLAVCPQVVAADAGRGLLPNLPSLPDGPGQGPAAGILGAARAWPGHPLLVLACDLPQVPAALLELLVRAAIFPPPDGAGGESAARAAPASAGAGEPGPAEVRAPADWVVPRWQRGLEPLCALYLPAALAALAAAVERGTRWAAALHRLAEIESLNVLYLEGDCLQRFGDPEGLFLNLNTPLELERWLESERAGGGQKEI